MELFEEDDDFEFGGIPDPSTRSWRHPSEIAAEAAAAEREPTPTPQQIKPDGTRRPYLVGSVIAAAVCTMGLAVVGIVGPGRAPDSAAPKPSGVAAGFNQNPTPRTSADPTETTITANADIGVFSQDNDSRFLARFVQIDSKIITSASALGNQSVVHLRLRQGSGSTSEIVLIEAVVTATHPQHDVAVLAPSQPIPADVEMPWTFTAEEVETNQDQATRVGSEDCSPGTETVWGDIRFTDIQAQSPSGTEMNGMVQTSIKANDCSAGSAVISEDGKLVGMAVSSKSPVILFTPASTLTV